MNTLPQEILIRICTYVGDPELIKSVFGQIYFNTCVLDRIKTNIELKKNIRDNDNIPYRQYYEKHNCPPLRVKDGVITVPLEFWFSEFNRHEFNRE